MKRNRKIGTTEPILRNITQTTVRFSEVDSMQVVWHGEYVRYFEDGREAFGRQFTGIGYLDFYAEGYTAPIVDLQLQCISPLRLNDKVLIETRYIDTPAAKLCFEYIITRQSDSALIAKGSSVQVFIDSDGNMCLNNPEFFQNWKRKWLEKQK
ncbi:MAG TPA: acyl-CoA thioesterase [Bacteroidales bacterium]|nr:acyl-CoA thioesterase [Bacteroidales bacterium]